MASFFALAMKNYTNPHDKDEDEETQRNRNVKS